MKFNIKLVLIFLFQVHTSYTVKKRTTNNETLNSSRRKQILGLNHHKRSNENGNFTKNDLKYNPHLQTKIANDNSKNCKSGLMTKEKKDLTWKKNGCEECSCLKNNQVFCRKPNCPESDCEKTVQVEGECCPMCPERLCKASDGRYFKNGAEWNLNDCTTCECRKGVILCSVEDCKYKGPKAIKVPGFCCPVTPDVSCLDVRGDDITVWNEGPCRHCYCLDGENFCADVKCPHVTCTNPYKEQGSCCYKCKDALDCKVTPWGTWSECPVQECGGGMRRRKRHILYKNKNGGAFCPHLSEAHECPKISCDLIPECETTEWSAWTHCTSTCGTGRKRRVRHRVQGDPRIHYSFINSCNKTHFEEFSRCIERPCLKYDPISKLVDFNNNRKHCPETTWSEWGPCSKTCGSGVKIREQILVNNTKTNNTCHLLTETEKCHVKCKNAVENCKLFHWGSWSPCSKSCGKNGEKSRTRGIKRQPKNGGAPCGELYSTKACKMPACTNENTLQPNKSEENSCEGPNGELKSENEDWYPEPCIFCTCKNQRKICKPIYCPPTKCENPVFLPGNCCSFCESNWNN